MGQCLCAFAHWVARASSCTSYKAICLAYSWDPDTCYLGFKRQCESLCQKEDKCLHETVYCIEPPFDLYGFFKAYDFPNAGTVNMCCMPSLHCKSPFFKENVPCLHYTCYNVNVSQSAISQHLFISAFHRDITVYAFSNGIDIFLLVDPCVFHFRCLLTILLQSYRFEK